ncbi:hypothetical protein Sme01_08920 [Sphaerisporangium melleum]|uniref:Uncharacterized protein n=1 Tax=Sphaerisporangium melleum TaxID=321316 RepID=A0A917QWK7_9ACTN|nr:hypothetical protein [Sphaerisporangium melleum]GGK71780.1 hypothetical protein GCM10007964_13270 [Sphaerisporangium melleum]GII68416.1 hypothetical protein Sme01_08920 [Sphaerisporangium melleum]
MPIDDDLVPNPRHQDLEAALAAVRAHVQALETVLDPACAKFGGQAVWVGPTARVFGEEMNGRRARIKTAVHHVLAELEAELRSTPTQISRVAATTVAGWS